LPAADLSMKVKSMVYTGDNRTNDLDSNKNKGKNVHKRSHDGKSRDGVVDHLRTDHGKTSDMFAVSIFTLSNK
jgi:hypothetical protein